jgi:hypothetical protein
MGLGCVVRKAVGWLPQVGLSAVIRRTRIGCTSEPSHQRRPGSQRGIMMTESTHEAVLHRLGHVERAMRRWQVGGGLALALLVSVVLMGAVWRTQVEAPDEVRARAFVLVDREGKPRMDLRVARNDSTHLVLFDREGQPQLSLNVLAQGGADLVIRDQLSQPRAVFSVMAEGRPGLSFFDGAGKTQLSLGVFPDGQAHLVLYAHGGQRRWATP